MTVVSTPSAEFWDSRYRQADQIWSGNPNGVLVREVADLAPGRALDLGCGEGADAIWLATRGWRVTATDVSRVALDRAARQAAAEHVTDLIDWQQHDLSISFPAGTFDLVAASYLHSPVELPREQILRTAASAVAPGGILLILGHAGLPPSEADTHPGPVLPTPEQVLEALQLAEGEWEVLRCEEYERTQIRPDGQPATRTDNVLTVRRLPS